MLVLVFLIDTGTGIRTIEKRIEENEEFSHQKMCRIRDQEKFTPDPDYGGKEGPDPWGKKVPDPEIPDPDTAHKI
jgi:hypothetical protein